MATFVERFSLGGSRLVTAVKDSIDVAGYPTKAGSAALESVQPAATNAVVVDAMLEAGCQIVGKLNLHELAFGMTGVNGHTGTPNNPIYPDYIPGGSSSGSAVAVADSSVDFSLGTDTGGSVRVPAACCGVMGLKPTFGRVDRRGVMPEETTLDCVGPFARSAEMLIEAMSIIDSTFQPIDAVGEIVLGKVQVNADSDVLAPVNKLLSDSGLDIVESALPSMKEAFDAGLTLINAETWAACGHLLDSGKVGTDVAQRLLKAKETSAAEVANAEAIRKRFTSEVEEALETSTVLVMPTLPSFPLKRDEALAGKADLNVSAFVRPFNLSGHPALSMPLNEIRGRPASLQIVAKKGEDPLLCEVARILSGFAA